MKNFDRIDAFLQNAAHGNLAEVSIALSSGLSPDARDRGGRTALHWACQEGQVEVVRCLLDNGAPLDAQDMYGFTPLATAAGEANAELVKMLLKEGADPRLQIENDEGGTPLHTACAYGHLDVVQALLTDSRVDINLKDKADRRPLDFARDGGFELIVAYLKRRGAV